jgi:nicotinate-nucleotide pyrophosphorylase (carboxylating)
MNNRAIDALIRAALREDAPAGDVTSESLVPPKLRCRAVFLAKQDGVLAGIDIAARVFRLVHSRTSFNRLVRDGCAFGAGDVLAEIEGLAVSLLKAERTALNFVQRLSGIATATRRFVDAVAGTKTKILDTRKTTPGLRVLEKYAVRMGGGVNHRMGLSDMVLIKDNHLMLAPGVAAAVSAARRRFGRRLKIEVEATNFAQAREALESGADRIMLDNMTLPAMKRIVDWIGGRVPIEVSGGVDLVKLRKIAALGVDFVSIGRLTHSPGAVDVSLEFLGVLDGTIPRIPLHDRPRRLRES